MANKVSGVAQVLPDPLLVNRFPLSAEIEGQSCIRIGSSNCETWVYISEDSYGKFGTPFKNP